MLFNSYTFIFLFLLVVLAGYDLVGRLQSRRAVLGWLIACSVLFYGLWNPLSLAIILPSIAINFAIARWMQVQLLQDTPSSQRLASLILALGIAFNLCLLGYFKYRNFLLDSANQMFGSQFALVAVLLPLGISFITFQKIAFLVDVRVGAIKSFDAFDFLIFVFFFPQLIAGPIVHYREMMPQFAAVSRRLTASDLAVGLCLFAIGLFKKAVLADGIAPYATGVFTAAERGEPVTLVIAWLGALAYTLQIYFDFSGYSDMAIGLARMFGIRLPANFNSPLKASSIIDFWSRWHMTLTRFLTAYVYTPLVMRLTRRRIARGQSVLGRNNRDPMAFVVLLAWPTIATMFLSGLWHGAGLTFIVWGLLHGGYLMVNHAWRLWQPKFDKQRYERVMKPLGFVITFTAVVVAMVFFRAKTMAGAGHMLHGMLGLDGLSLPAAVLGQLGTAGAALQSWGVAADLSSGSTFASSVLWVLVLLLAATCLPNSLEAMRRFEPALDFQPAAGRKSARGKGQPADTRWAAALTPAWAACIAVLLVFGLLSLNRVSEFLYWQF